MSDRLETAFSTCFSTLGFFFLTNTEMNRFLRTVGGHPFRSQFRDWNSRRSSVAISGILYARIMERQIPMPSFLELQNNEVISKELVKNLNVQSVSLGKTDPQCLMSFYAS